MPDAKRPAVCIVDDDRGIRESLRFLFEDAGYAVEEAEDGAQALALLQLDARPRVLLLDRMMPRLNGAQTLRRLGAAPAAVRRRTAVIFMSARSDRPTPEVAALIRQHAYATVAKPFDLDALLATVEGACQRLAERVGAR